MTPTTDIPLGEEKKGSPVKLMKLSLAGAELYFANNVNYTSYSSNFFDVHVFSVQIGDALSHSIADTQLH